MVLELLSKRVTSAMEKRLQRQLKSQAAGHEKHIDSIQDEHTRQLAKLEAEYNSRLQEAESKLRGKDTEISQLSYELSRLSEELEKNQSSQRIMKCQIDEMSAAFAFMQHRWEMASKGLDIVGRQNGVLPTQ